MGTCNPWGRLESLTCTSPWHNWIARRPPEPKVRGSNPLGDAVSLPSQTHDLPLLILSDVAGKIAQGGRFNMGRMPSFSIARCRQEGSAGNDCGDRPKDRLVWILLVSSVGNADP